MDPAYIKIGDEYLDPERTYRLVTKAYLANGKDGYDVLAKCKQVWLSSSPLIFKVQWCGIEFLQLLHKPY